MSPVESRASNHDGGPVWDLKFLFAAALVCAVVALAQEQSSGCPAECAPATCPYPDRDSFLEHIKSDFREYNRSSFPPTACNICETVLGSGNPDISGVGAMISYGIQGLTATLFGPLLMVLRATFLSGPSNGSRPSLHRPLRYASKVAQHVIQTNNALTWSILIAAAVRTRQAVPAAELGFLECLVRYQVLISMMMCAASTTIFERLTSPLVSSIVTFALLRCIRSTSELWEDHGDALDSVEDYCAAAARGASPGEGLVYMSNRLAFRVFWISIGSAAYVIGFSASHHTGLLPPHLASFYDGPFIGTLVAYTLCSGGALVVLLWNMKIRRMVLRSMAGVAYEDDEWGFGQVMAVLLWVPLLQALAKGMPGFFERQFDRVFDWVWFWIRPYNRT